MRQVFKTDFQIHIAWSLILFAYFKIGFFQPFFLQPDSRRSSKYLLKVSFKR